MCGKLYARAAGWQKLGWAKREVVNQKQVGIGNGLGAEIGGSVSSGSRQFADCRTGVRWCNI